MQTLYDLYALLFARPIFYRANRVLFRLALSGMGILNWRSEALQGELGLLRWLLRTAPDGATVLDVGAHEGRYCEHAITLAPHLRVHAFEPNPASFSRLRRRMEPHGVRCWNFALGAYSGKTRLFDYPDCDGSSHASLHSRVFSELHKKSAHVLKVDIRRLDEFIKNENITEIFLLKIDAEGSERQILEGAGELIKREEIHIQYIQIEFNEMNAISKTFLSDLQDILPGYRSYRILLYGNTIDITEERPLMTELFAFQNILFTKQNV